MASAIRRRLEGGIDDRARVLDDSEAVHERNIRRACDELMLEPLQWRNLLVGEQVGHESASVRNFVFGILRAFHPTWRLLTQKKNLDFLFGPLRIPKWWLKIQVKNGLYFYITFGPSFT